VGDFIISEYAIGLSIGDKVMIYGEDVGFVFSHYAKNGAKIYDVIDINSRPTAKEADNLLDKTKEDKLK